jgi:hypothetical protein
MIYLFIYRLRRREVLHEDKEPRFVAKDDLPAASRGYMYMPSSFVPVILSKKKKVGALAS